MAQLTFTEEEISDLFGHEAAEDESVERLKGYYFKTDIYEQATSDHAIRLLVGHKGVGKSALFSVAVSEDRDAGRLSIVIKPDDIIGIAEETGDALAAIRDWKIGLNRLIAEKVLTQIGVEDAGALDKAKKAGANLLGFLGKVAAEFRPDFNRDPAHQALIQNFVKTKRIIIYIDDLDRAWSGRQSDVKRLSALLNAVRDLARDNQGLYFRIALRADVYYLVRTSDESTDKIEGSVVWLKYSNHEILVMLVKRLNRFFREESSDANLANLKQGELGSFLHRVFVPRFAGLGHWHQTPIHRVLLSLVRKRPRDLVKLCTLAARQARSANHAIIETDDLKGVFEDYSQGRLQDTYNEYRSEFPDIERLLLNMKPNKKEKKTKLGYTYTTADLRGKVKNIIAQGEFRFSNGRVADVDDLIGLMYKINFLTARKELDGKIVRKYFEENRYIHSVVADFGFDWEIHPAYRWALQPEDPATVLSSIDSDPS